MTASVGLHAARRLLGGALLLTLAAGAVCRQQNDGPGDVPPGGDCAVPADMVATIAPVAAEYCTYSLSQPDTCACGDAQGPLPPDVILPYGDSSILLGCHQDVGDLGIRYVHESCALIAEVSGPVVWDYNPPGDDDDRVYAVCPEAGTMRVDPWTGPPTELRTQGSFMAPATLLGSMHIEIQDCRWYDGVYAFDGHVLDDTDSTYSFGSRPTFGDQLAVAGDWVADFNHNGTEREEAHAEIHEARMLAKVQRVNAIDDMHYVALTNGFFAIDSPQQERLHLDIPIPRSQDPLFNKLTCELISAGYGVAPSCGTKSGVLVKPVSANSALGTCTVELTRNDAVAPNDYNCTDTCNDLLYPDDPAFCDSVHFMSPVRAEWKDPADLWMCNSCACDDPSAPGAHITAPVQGCAQAGLDPNNPDHQAIACAQVCGGTFCGGSPACVIGQCHPPTSGGVATLIAPSACDPFAPPPMVRVAASGDYHLTIRGADDGSGSPVSSVIYTLGEEAAVGAVAGEMRVNVGIAEATAAIDIAETRIFPADVAIGDLAMTSAVVSTAERPFGHFTTDTVFSVPAGVGVLVARANLNGELIGVNVVNPAPYIGTFDLATRTFSFSIQASSGGDSTDPDSQTSMVASLYGVIDNVPPVADAGGPARTVECASHTTTPVVLAGQGSYDPDAGDSITHYQWFTSLGGPVGNHPEEAVALPFGTSLFVLHVYDLDLSAAQTPLEVNVVDTTPPTLDVEPTSFCLWPPDHRRVRFHLGSDVSAVAGDICDPAPTVRITSVSSDEADNGIGDGDATGDIAFGPNDFCVRRERAGTGDGRVYTVTIEARDFSGNTTVREVRVAVPHGHEPGCAGKTAGTVIGDADACH